MTTARVPIELETELREAAARVGCELIHLEFKGHILRLFIDRLEEGVTLGDCEAVSRQASALLDVADFSSGRYTLEVSSPGLDRRLFSEADYGRFTGHLVRVTWRDPEAGQKQTIVGRLDGLTAATGRRAARIDCQPGGLTTIPLDQIELARLEIEL